MFSNHPYKEKLRVTRSELIAMIRSASPRDFVKFDSVRESLCRKCAFLGAYSLLIFVPKCIMRLASNLQCLFASG